MKDEQQPQPPEKRPRKRERLSQSVHAASFPFYFRDWLSSPEVRALSPAERGAFIDILCFTWLTHAVGEATEDQVRAWGGYTTKEWPKHREAIRACFHVRADGMWVQRRAKREREAQKRRFKSASEAGKKSAAKRNEGKEKGKVVDDPVGPTVPTKTEPCPRSLVLGPRSNSERQVVPSPDGSSGSRGNGIGTADFRRVGEILAGLPLVEAARRSSP